MTASQLATVLEAFAVAACLVLVVFHVIRTVRLDSLRQKLFTVRDEMFDYAADGNISFTDPAYQLLRDEMNGFIRYAHQLTLFRVLMSVLMRYTHGGISNLPRIVAWDKSVSAIKDERVRSQMGIFHDRAMHNVLKHFIVGSPCLLLIVIAAMCCISIRQAAHASYSGVKQLSRSAAALILRGPFDPRFLEEEAFSA